MKKLLVVLGLAAGLFMHGSTAVAQEAGKNKEKELIYVSAESATFVEAMPGVSMAAVWGDGKTGALEVGRHRCDTARGVLADES